MNLKGKKLFAGIMLSIMTLCLLFSQKEVYAETGNFWVDINENKQATSTAYGVGNPTLTGGQHIWELLSYLSQTGTTTDNKKLYCVKAGVSATWNDSTKWNDPTQRRVNYTTGYNIKTGKTEINDLPNTQSVYKEIATGNYYKQILWIIDNMYIPGTGDGKSSAEDRKNLLNAAANFAGIDLTDSYYSDMPLSDDDIEVVQQLALWYYTNHDEQIYTYEEEINNALWIKNSVTGGSWKQLYTFNQDNGYGERKADQMDALYKYLIAMAEANKDEYVEKDSLNNDLNELKAPVTIAQNQITAENLNTNYYKVGPINITKNNDLPYSIDVTVKDGNGNQVSDISYVKADGTSVDINQLAFTNNQAVVYVKVPKTAGSKLDIDMNINYKTTNAILWFPGNSNLEQPIIEVTKQPHKDPVHFSTDEQEFDLSLRKFITKIEDSNGNSRDYSYATRVPALGDWTLDNGTTEIKSHVKTPLKVSKGDKVTYTIRIYNEGKLDGTATKITDYLPEGLEFISASQSTINNENGWSNPSGDGKTIVTEKLKNETIIAYDGTSNPAYKDVQIECKVIATNTEQSLKNIAEITEDYNASGVADRDSNPDNVNKDVNNYNPEAPTTGKGEQDDDDYEDLILKEFDLSLRKFITAIAPQGNMDEMYEVDTREPELDGSWGTGKDATTLNKQHRKDPLPVKSGDYVLYTIRVYNEGEIDGYASLIKDTFQDGLEFINSQDEAIKKYNGIWQIEQDGSITTDWLAKGKGKEDGYSEGDANYTANLIKALKTDNNGNVTISKTDPLNPDYRDVQVLLKVTESNESNRTLDNRAQIADDSDKDGNPVDDRDSTPNQWIDGEDDQDHDPVRLQSFDLALRKFISKVDGTEPAVSRDPNGNIDASELATGNETTAKYNHTKKPLQVNKDSKITYTIRVYNEGDVDGYASKITDHLPEYLEYIPANQSQVNTDYGWEISSDGRTATTSYLAPTDDTTVNKNEKIITARNGETLSYRYVEIECKIKDGAQVGTYLTNIAEISEYKDDKGETVNPDRDSTSNNVNLPSDTDLPGYKDDEIDSGKTYIPGQEDDDDFEKIVIVKKVDLALTKFITAVSSDANIEDGEYLTPDKKIGSKTNEYTRATVADTRGLKAGTSTNATYTEKKDIEPLVVGKNSYILYNIRVYNEGEVNVFAGEITDYLPENLEFVQGEFNTNYGWTAEGQTVKTNYLSKANGDDKILKAFDKENDDGAGSGLDYKDLPVLCKVSSNAPTGRKLINTAEITKYEDENGNTLPNDVDSTPENKQTKNVENREEDDDDYEVVILQNVDLALTKFITAISDDQNIEDGEYLTLNRNAWSETNPYTRQTKVDSTELKAGTSTDAVYTRVKDPLTVNKNSYVLYNIRVYNEGDVDVFAGEVTDYLPENLDFVNGDFNKQYGWSAQGQTIKTNYLSSENGKDKMLKAFDRAGDDNAGSGIDYKDLPILCQVNSKTPSNKELINTAEITKYEDENGKELPNDVDSTPENKKTKNDKIREEDDDDYEVVVVQDFDLSLIKYVSQVIVTEGGKTTTTNTKNTGNKATDIIPKVEVHKKKINSTTVKFVYTIKVTNEGDIEGYAKEITDYIPAGLKFVQADNPSWTTKGDGAIATNALADTLLKPGESAPVTVVFTWINGADNLNLKRNYAEISEDYNEYGVPDKDSTPNNKIENEDDIDYADVLLSIKTGKAVTYIFLVGAILIVLAGGIILIRKYVL